MGRDWSINDPVWAIELLREGIKGKEHQERFDQPTGLYNNFPVEAGCKAVIDFHCSAPKEDFQRLADTHYVFLSEDRTSAQYFRPGATIFEPIKFLLESNTNALPMDNI